MRKLICLVITYNGKLLVINRRGKWVLPRKKPKIGELEVDCIFDEIIKEVPGLELKDLRPLGRFNGRNFLQWSPLRDKVYLAKAEKQFFNNCLENDGKIKWISNLKEHKLSNSTRKIFWILKAEGCL